VGANNDMLDWLLVTRTMEMEKTGWSMQLHSHPDFEEYWFVLEGKGKIICGDETYEVEPGDLVITPRGMPHRALGDVKFICCTAKHNVYGQPATRLQYKAHDKPVRANPSDAPDIGVYVEIDPMEHIPE
jgi:glyoxylate utilization-related uncharacterized protein